MDLKAEEKALVLKIVEEIVPGAKIMVFGSRATGKSGSTSDLDLAIKWDTALGFAKAADLEEALLDSDLPFLVSVVDINTASPWFVKRISKEWQLLQ